MMLAFFRFTSVCLQTNSWFSKQTSLKPTIKRIVIICAMLLIPSVVWTASMFFGCPAAGKAWNFGSIDDLTNSTQIIAFQEISDEVRTNGQSGILVMAIFLFLQLIVTLFLYIKICRTSFKSSMNISLKRTYSCYAMSEKLTSHTVVSGCSNIPLERTNYRKQSKKYSDTTHPTLKMVKSISFSENNLQSNFSNNHYVPKRTQSCRKFNRKRTSEKNIQTSPVRNHQHSTTNAKINTKQLFKIPLSKHLVCVSRKDIFCTTSLGLQILCLFLTHGLTIFAFKISGQKVTLQRFIFSYYAFELAFLINTMIHPLICILFSSNYRDAAKSIMLKIKRTCTALN